MQGIWGVDEIHQVWFKDLVDVPQATVTAPVENLDTQETTSFNIYPSPVKDELNIVWSDILENPVHWKLISTSGSIVKEGITSAGNVKEQIDTYHINDYICHSMLITSDDRQYGRPECKDFQTFEGGLGVAEYWGQAS